jgi:hypothetical protein
MGFDPNDDSDNDLPDWLKGMQSDEENGGYEPDQSYPTDAEENLPSWLKGDEQEGFPGPEHLDGGDETPEWLANIRKQESDEDDQHTPITSDEEDEENQAWLDSIREKATPAEEPEVEGEDFLKKIQELKVQDPIQDDWGDEEEEPQDDWGSPKPKEDPIAAAWDKESGTLNLPEEEEDEIPDWVKGLPSLDPAELSAASQRAAEEPEEEEIPDWLNEIRQKTSEDTKQPEEVLPSFGLQPDLRDEMEDQEPEPEEEPAREEEAFSESPPVTGSLPSWLENLQTTALVESTADAEEERRNTADYVEGEDVSALFEDADLPDWLGEEAEESEAAEEEELEEEVAEPGPALDENIPKGELPSWLQAMRPVEAVTPEVEDEAEPEDEEKPDRETVGPLSGLRDVLPAEPHIINFGSKPKLPPGFELTESQQNYAKILKSLVEEESVSAPAERRGIANPQQVLRWIIAILLLTITFSVLWWNGNIMPLPGPPAIPEENLAAISLVDKIGAGDKVLVAVEYQPGLSGELEAASAALLDDLVWSDAQLVLVSSQPIGPGLADAFLQRQFSDSAYISNRQYVNLGYLSGGAAGLLNFALDPRQAKPEMKWNQEPLQSIQTIRDFALVLVITDDPDVARSWVEQVQPLLDLNQQSIPLVMVVSAQAEPLVYPYYSTTPRQVSGLVSGISGGAFYETIHGASLARRYWDAYNIGLILAVLVVAVGSLINLTRNTFSKMGKGRS